VNKKEEKIVAVILTTFIFFYSFCFFAKKINLTTADLGRHIKNGEIALETRRIVSTNFYSYTEPNNKTINHHWASGIILAKIHEWVGFSGLSFFYAIISAIPIVLFFLIAKQETSIKKATIVSILTIPLIANRTEIRPEGFSYLLLGILFFTLYKFRKKQLKFRFVLPLILGLQLLWVNLHIFFIFGIFLIGIFWLDGLINKKDTKYFKQISVMAFLATITCLINPNGFKGLIEPFMIFREYGYMIVENQSVLFMQERFPKFLYTHYEIMLLLIPIFLVLFVKEKSLKERLPFAIPTIVFAVLGFKMIRIIPLFGFFAIPFFAKVPKLQDKNVNTLFLFSVGLGLLGIFTKNFYYSPFNTQTGMGLLSNINKSAEFFKENNLEGPIFNNYDIGGYLIYHLYPEQKVFVDNRPEAYSVDFLKNVYIKMQENEKIWQQQDKSYNFQTIYFYRHDATPWAQPFLIERIKDPNWIPVYVDDYAIILVKDNKENKEIIEKYKLPEKTFVVTP